MRLCRRRKGVSHEPSRKRILRNGRALGVGQKVWILEQDARLFGYKSPGREHRRGAELLQTYTGFKLGSAFVFGVSVRQGRRQNENRTVQHRILRRWECRRQFTRSRIRFLRISCLLPPPRRLCFRRCLFVCLSVCLSVCLLATLLKNFGTELHEIFREGWQWPSEQMVKFWWQSESRSGIVFRSSAHR